MPRAHLFLVAVTTIVGFTLPATTLAQPLDARIDLVVRAGTPLRVALAERVAVTHIGQQITGTLVEPVYAYDRLVLPVGTPVVGHVSALDGPATWTRLRAWAAGDFAPKRHVVVQFDSVAPNQVVPVQAIGLQGTVNVRRHVAPDAVASPTDPPPSGVVGRAKQEITERARGSIAAAKQKTTDAIAAITEPGKAARLKALLINRLPYHRQYLTQGTVYDAELQTPVTFGRVEPTALAIVGSLPAPSSILRARLAVSLDSATTTRGARVDAVVTEPVLSTDHQLILPEGTHLTGAVTVAQPARRFHRNGQLRFLFERVETPQHQETALLASLHAVDVSADDHLAVDEEGGARVADSKTRFVAPALAVLALAGATAVHDHPLDEDDAGFGTGAVRHSNDPAAQSLGGFFGFGLIGAGVARLSHPVGIAVAAVGVARTLYANVLGKGREVRFAADTPIELRLAPGPSPAQ